MKPQSMEEKISYRLFFMGFVGLVCTAVLCLFVFHKAFREQAWTSLEHQADLVSAGYEQLSSPDQLSVFVNGDLRITLIAADGSVVFESATDQQMENHLSRPEIQQAMREGVGRNCRDSQTMGYETYYYAMLLPGGDILRVAQDSETIWSIYDAALPAIILSCILMMGAAALIAGLLTRSLVQPILKMTDDLEHIQENVPYRELIPFAESIHSDRLLRENNEKMRQDFTANVSHELKTPMTTIAGYLDGILDGTIPPEKHRVYMELVSTEVRRLSRLVRNMLDVARLKDQGIPPDKLTDFDICEEASQALLSFEQRINQKHLNVDIDMPEFGLTVHAFADAVSQVIYNLLDNAVKFIDDGGTLSIHARQQGGKAVVSIANTGPTIDPAELPLIFDRFHKTDKSRSTDRDGVGLGLYIVKTIVLAHGEDIYVTSRDGKTEFTFTMPLKK